MTEEYSGILLVDKPAGMTSHDVVAYIRKKGHFRKVGHAGTLDPFATGLLVILVGKTTRAASHFIQDDKSYEGTITLGLATQTGDPEGEVIRRGSYDHVSVEKARTVFESLLGPQEQVPPMYSAVKQNGKKLYELARKGIEVERPPRSIRIRTFELLRFEPPALSFFLACSKGTYVRVLAETAGERLGCPAHLSSLRRLRSGNFSIEEAVSFESLRQNDSPFLRTSLKNASFYENPVPS